MQAGRVSVAVMGRDHSDGDCGFWHQKPMFPRKITIHFTYRPLTIDQKGDQNGDSFHVTLIGIDYKGEMGIHSMGH